MSSTISRRALLGAGPAVIVGTAGCSSNLEEDDTTNQSDSSAAGGQTDDDGETSDCHVRDRHEQGSADPIETSVADTDDSCGVKAARAAVDHAETQLDTQFDSTWGTPGYSRRPGDETGEARVNLFAMKNTDGDYVVCPPRSFEEVVDATPAEVTVTISVEGEDDEQCTYEIYVNQTTEQEG